MSLFKSILRATPPVTKNIIIINTIIWMAMFLSPTINGNMMNYCALHYQEAPGFNPAQLITYMFMHGGFFHLIFNMFTLYMLGSSVEYTLGSRRFLLFYMVCGIGAGLIQEAVWALTLPDIITNELAILNKTTSDHISALIATDPSIMTSNMNFFTTVGASGSIYGVLLAFAMLYPNRPLYFMFLPVPIKAKWMMLIWGGLELLLGLSEARDGIAHFAHLGGMIFGFMMIAYWKKKGSVNGDGY